MNSLPIEPVQKGRNNHMLPVRLHEGQINLKFINTQYPSVLYQGNPTYGVEVHIDAVQ